MKEWYCYCLQPDPTSGCSFEEVSAAFDYLPTMLRVLADLYEVWQDAGDRPAFITGVVDAEDEAGALVKWAGGFGTAVRHRQVGITFVNRGAEE